MPCRRCNSGDLKHASRLSNDNWRKVSEFSRLQYSPNRAKYTRSQKTRTDVLAAAYQEVSK